MRNWEDIACSVETTQEFKIQKEWHNTDQLVGNPEVCESDRVKRGCENATLEFQVFEFD